MPTHLVLVGLMATGKTTVGHLVADRLDVVLCDSDAAVEARTGRTVRDIWVEDGEPAFRVLETDVLNSALDDTEPSVVAAAGGVVLSPDNRRRLQDDDVVVVWLRADPETLVERIERPVRSRRGRARDEDHRPLLDDDAAVAMARMAGDRRPLYEEVADHVIDVDGLAPHEVADRVVALVGELGDVGDAG